MKTTPVILAAPLSTLDLEESQPAIYDRPIQLRQLYADPDSGAEHYLIRYPAGLQGQRHRHTAAHTIIVLEGTLEVDGELLHAGSYARHPGGTVMQHRPAAGSDCVFLIMFDGPFDVIAVDD
jgi:quercetin dioxygenase-like cupin family protein